MNEKEYEKVIESLLVAARKDFPSFLHVLYPQTDNPTYILSKFHTYLAQLVQEVIDGRRGPNQSVSVPPQHGKECSLDSPILTTKGWKKHGDLIPGDYVYHPSGKPVRVEANIPQEEPCTIEVDLSTGETIKVHPNHEWTLHKDKRYLRTVETKELLDAPLWRGEKGKRGSRAIWQLPYAYPLDMPEKDLPVDPHWLGYWLGNGEQKSHRLTICDQDSELLTSWKYKCSAIYDNGPNNASKHYGFGKQNIVKDLRGIKVLSNKHIPDVYFTASKRQRLELLAGLIDSDGSLYKKTGQYRFINCNERLVNDVVSLIYTFGWKCSVSWTEPCTSTSGIEGKQRVCQVGFTPTEEIPCRIPRKQSKKFVTSKHVGIVGVRECAPVPGNCIQIDSEDGLYLVGRTLQPTHNSRLLCVRAVAFLIGYKPGIHVALTGFSFRLLADFLKEIKDILNTDVYKAIFPGVSPVKGRDREGDITFENKSSIQVKSAGSKLTGRRVDWLVIDDPHAGRREAESETHRRNVEQWFFGDCISRLSPDAKTFLISTRWHMDDLHGIVTNEEYEEKMMMSGLAAELFQVTNLPGIAEDNDTLGRKPGEALFPEQRPVSFLESLKARMPGYEWDSQYRGNPRTSSGDLADIKSIRMVEYDQVPKDIEWVRGWDPAVSDKTVSDYTAGALCAARFDSEGYISEFYLIDMIRQRMPWAKMRFTVVETARNENMQKGVYRIGIEGVAGFKSVFEDVKRELLGKVEVSNKVFQGGKLLRAQPWLNLIEAGRFFMVRGPWNKEFELELERFPLGAKDDQIDAVSISRELLCDRNTLLIA